MSSVVKLSAVIVLLLGLLSPFRPAPAAAQEGPFNIALAADPSGSTPGMPGANLPEEIVDGQTTYPDEAHGIRFYGGAICGVRQAVVDWGTLHPFNRVLVWHHLSDNIQTYYHVEYWDGDSWQSVGGTSSVRTDLAVANATSPTWSIPTETIFPAVTGSKVRYWWNNCALDKDPGWIWEFEVYSDTPLSHQQYGFSGFLPPVDELNTGKAGRTYPVKWQLTDASGAYVGDLSAITSITAGPGGGACGGDEVIDVLRETSGGDSTWRYDSASNQFIYNWRTPGTPGCYALVLTLADGQTGTAYFDLR